MAPKKKVTAPTAKRGRPATGRSPHLTLRLPADELAALDRLAKRLKSTRSAAIRQAIQKAVESE